MTEEKEELKWDEYFYYDESSPSGLRWKVDRFAGKDYKIPLVKAGDKAGSVSYHQDGRKMAFQIRLCGRSLKIHRIIWEMFNGKIPDGYMIDHLDGDPFNNNIINLKLKTRRGNQQNQKLRRNSTTGVKGVSWATRKDSQHKYAEARVCTKDGEVTKVFSTRYLGHDGALAAAKAWREAKLLELNSQGEDYTDRHIYG